MPPRYRTNLRVFRHREWIIRSRCRSAAARAPISRWRDSRVGRCGSASCLGVLYCAGLPLEWRICAAAPGSSRVAGDRRCHQSLSFGEGQGSLRYEAPMGACSLKNADEAALHIRRRDPLINELCYPVWLLAAQLRVVPSASGRIGAPRPPRADRVTLPGLAFGGSGAGLVRPQAVALYRQG
jgi:hypothetical protein